MCIRVYGFIILLILSNQLLSQQTIIANSDIMSGLNGDLIYGTSQFKGHPYLDLEWQKVQIEDLSGNKKELDKAKFDICSQKLLVVIDQKELWINDHQIKSFVLFQADGGQQRFIKSVENEEFVYYEVLFAGDLSIFRSYKKQFVKPRPTDNFTYGSDGNLQPYFKDTETNFVARYGTGEFVNIKSNGKDLDKVFDASLRRKAESFMKKNKPNNKSIAELLDYVQLLSDHMAGHN